LARRPPSRGRASRFSIALALHEHPEESLMYERILVATDGSRRLWQGLPLVARLAEPQAKTLVYHVPESTLVPALYGDDRAKQMGLETPTDAAALVRRWTDRLRTLGVNADGKVATHLATTTQLILREAREVQSDLVVVGSRGLSPLRGLVTGSVSHVVLQLAQCAVLVVRGRSPGRRLERVLLAYDGSRHARRALRTAALLAERLGAQVVVAHSRPFGQTKGDRVVEEAVTELRAQDVSAQSLIVDGDWHPGPDLALAARQERCDLVLMGARGHTELEGLFLGTVTFKMVQLSPCPVLVAR